MHNKIICYTHKILKLLLFLKYSLCAYTKRGYREKSDNKGTTIYKHREI